MQIMELERARGELRNYKGRTNLKLDELVEVVNYLIEIVVPEQPSDRVAETLNERTLRYYITGELVDRPLGKDGASALYGYRHLLQVLVLKALQGNYMPIKRIREIMEGKSDEDLESLLAVTVMEIFTKRDPVTRDLTAPLLEGILKHKSGYRLHSKGLSFSRVAPENVVTTAQIAKPNASSWKRIEVEPGFEIHVKEDYKPKGRNRISLLLSKMKHFLSEHMED